MLRHRSYESTRHQWHVPSTARLTTAARRRPCSRPRRSDHLPSLHGLHQGDRRQRHRYLWSQALSDRHSARPMTHEGTRPTSIVVHRRRYSNVAALARASYCARMLCPLLSWEHFWGHRPGSTIHHEFTSERRHLQVQSPLAGCATLVFSEQSLFIGTSIIPCRTQARCHSSAAMS
jgi:hypothetical protein